MTPVPQETTVLLADDYPLISYGLQQALQATADFRVVAEAYNGAEALTKLRKYKPSVAVVDMDLPQLDGFRVAAAARAEGLPSKIVLLCSETQASLLKRALRLGIRGCILKDSALPEIIAGVRTVTKGQTYFSPALVTEAITPHRSVPVAMDSSVGLTPDLALLTPTERAILKLVGECYTTKEIAARLFTSPRTVEKHRANICQKLEVRGNHALTKFALAYQQVSV